MTQPIFHYPEESTSGRKQLNLNGYPVIQCCRRGSCALSWYTEDVLLFFICRGRLRLRYGNESFALSAGQLGLLKKNIFLEGIVSGDGESDSLDYFQFTIKSDLVREFAKMTVVPEFAEGGTPAVIIRESSDCWLSYLRSLEPYMEEGAAPAAALIRIKMLELFFQLLGIDKDMLLMLLLDMREENRADIRATVEENITSPISVNQLAALSGRSPSSFRRDFAAIYNMPPSEWIRLKRMEKAKELLLGTTMSITDICYTLGFEYVAHFSKLFKSHFGYPPSEQRGGRLTEERA